MVQTNYRQEYFEHVDLTPVIGQPNFESLNKLKNELKANAQSVPCTLGGGNHGFLGLVLTNAEYQAIVPGVNFVPQPHPGNLVIPAGTTNVQARVIESNHNRELKLFEECVAMEQALKQQIVKAIHKDCLEPLRNPITRSLDHTIPHILAFLFNEHGDVSATAVARREDEIKQMQYDPATDPIDKIFTAVQEMAEFADAAGATYTERQIINFAYVILQKHRVFNDAITRYNREVRANPLNQTWVFFKQFFRIAYRELKEVGELTIADTPFNEANLISGIVDALQQCQIIDNGTPSPAPAENPTAPPTTPAPAPAANSATQHTDDVMTNILSQMMTMQGQVVDLTNQMIQHNNNNRHNNNQGGRGRGGGRGNEQRRMWYCWSHGWCHHPGAYCRNRREGHQPSATAENRMGGSVEGLPPGFV